MTVRCDMPRCGRAIEGDASDPIFAVDHGIEANSVVEVMCRGCALKLKPHSCFWTRAQCERVIAEYKRRRSAA